MTLEEIDDQLVNGFHDAVFIDQYRDYEHSTVIFTVDVLIGLPEDSPKDADRYKRGKITFQDVKLCSSEIPDGSSAFASKGGIWFTFERMEDGAVQTDVIERLKDSPLRYSFWIGTRVFILWLGMFLLRGVEDAFDFHSKVVL